MGELIDKAAVKAIIGRMQDCTMDEDGNFYSSSALAEYNILCDLENRLDTLEVKEDVVSTDTLANSLKISRNGNPRIEAMKEALRMEYEKGREDVLRDIDPDEMVADFCSQPLSKTRSIASIYRQGIIDLLKKIN